MYSPKIKDKFIKILYHLAKKEGRPMTKLVNEIIKNELIKREVYNEQQSKRNSK
ncbi:MAG: hypothetical protein ABIA04_08420 [Pseudomonadota bacterium]